VHPETAKAGFSIAISQAPPKMVLEAGYPDTTGFRKVVKVSVFIKKKDAMSDLDFIKHYNHTHAQMAAPVLLKHKIISYSLVRPSQARQLTPSF
jgi:hypothetical protein